MSYVKRINDKHRERLLYLLGHMFITLAMLIRIDEKNIGGLEGSVLGTIGHSFLLLFFVITTFVVDKKYRVTFSGELYYLNILCILGQIGMIIIYWFEYFEPKEDPETELKNKTFFEYCQIIISSILIFFYLSMTFKSDNKYSAVFVGLFMITGLYIISLYRNLHQHIKTIL
tara:strand:+ start:944 stop:1459 length:516 start_codon:yes stop_codon:yes gene_type:complete